MKSGIALLAVCALVVGFTGMAFGFAGETLYVPQINPAAVVLDGNDTEWSDPAFIDQSYMLTRDNLVNVTGGEMPTVDDWDGIIYMGWSAPPDNMFYTFCRVTDDVLNDEAVRNGDSWRDDNFEYFTDADAGGGDMNAVPPRGSIAQQFASRMTENPIPDGPGNDESYTQWYIFGAAERAWMTAPPLTEFALAHPVGRENVTYAWEGKFALWDLAGDSAELSERHTNALGDVIGFGIQCDDSDAEVDTRDAQPGTPGAGDAWFNADSFNETIFVEGEGTAVEPASWGAVKALFR